MSNRLLKVIALTALMTMAFATAAYAISPAYVDWTDAVAHNNAAYEPDPLGTPHKDYRLNTEKCSVCHSVHAAGWYKTADNTSTGVQNAGVKATGEASEMLLRGTVANACTYCHVTTAIGGKQIYTDAAGTANYYNGDTPFAHNGTPGHASCSGCHSVHGAKTIAGAVSSKILKTGLLPNDSLPYQAAFTTDKGDIETAADRNLQITGFCTKCHPTYSNASEQVVSTTGYFDDGGFVAGTKFYSNHPLKMIGGESGNAAGVGLVAQGSTLSTNTVAAAYIDAPYCRSCHAAGTDGTTVNTGIIVSSFPHNTPGNAEFLVAADNSLAVASGVASGSAGTDGVCLRCHSNGTLGVGTSF